MGRERAELCDNQVFPLNVTRFFFYFFVIFFFAKFFFALVCLFFSFCSNCFSFPDAGGHVSVFVRDGCVFFLN